MLAAAGSGAVSPPPPQPATNAATSTADRSAHKARKDACARAPVRAANHSESGSCTISAVSTDTPDLPLVSIVFLAYNRREELALSLEQMLRGSTYPASRLQVIVVDNASEDDTAAMVRSDFPEAELVVNPVNVGASGW